MPRRRGGDGVGFEILDGDGALMDLIFLYGAVMVFNYKLRADLYVPVQVLYKSCTRPILYQFQYWYKNGAIDRSIDQLINQLIN